ncbi:hypothetical protein SH449x_001317 [Pirellulaceae bacterium SH449]
MAWIPWEVDEQTLEILSDTNSIATVVNRLCRSSTTAAVAASLNIGLRELLRPDAVVIWAMDGRWANETRLTPLVQHRDIVQHRDLHDGLFAREIVTLKRPVTKRGSSNDSFRFQLGLPWFVASKNKTLGAIELSYDRDVTEDSEKIIARVAESLVVVAASRIMAWE